MQQPHEDYHDTDSLILGDRTRTKAYGIIRPGIQRLIAAANEAQRKRYEELLSTGMSFDEIDAELLKIAPKEGRKKSYLTPQNVDYFTIRRGDFRYAADADFINREYSDRIRNDGHVRAIPVTLTTNSIPDIVPHEFQCYMASGLRTYSLKEGGKVWCMIAPKREKDDTRYPSKKEFIRDTVNGRDGECSPVDCQLHLDGHCKLKGRLVVNVQGMAGDVYVPTQSWFGLAETVAHLKRVREVFGRINGVFNGKPFLRLVKFATKVPNKGKMTTQWLSIIEPAVAYDQLQAAVESGMQTRARAMFAAELLNGPAACPPAQQEGGGETTPTKQAQEAPPPNAPEPQKMSPDQQKVMAQLHQGIEKYGLNEVHVRAFAAVELGIPVLEDAPIMQMRELRDILKSKIEADEVQQFMADIADIARSLDEPPEPQNDDDYSF